MQTFFIGMGLLASVSCPSWLQGLISEASTTYGVDPRIVAGIIHCESGFNPSAEGDVGIHGMATTSWGLAQIHLPMHPEISKEQALDPHFAVDYLAKQISLGHGRMWSCYNKVL